MHLNKRLLLNLRNEIKLKPFLKKNTHLNNFKIKININITTKNSTSFLAYKKKLLNKIYLTDKNQNYVLNDNVLNNYFFNSLILSNLNKKTMKKLFHKFKLEKISRLSFNFKYEAILNQKFTDQISRIFIKSLV